MTREFAFTVLFCGIVVIATGQAVLFWLFSKLYHRADSLERTARARLDAERGVDDPEERQSNLVDHAKRELELLGEDPEVVDDYLRIIRIFADGGHSGYSAEYFTQVLTKLMRFENLTPLTDNPTEWQQHDEGTWGAPGGIYQNRRNGEAFSEDAGQTYYLLSERENEKPKLYHVSKPVNDPAIMIEEQVK